MRILGPPECASVARGFGIECVRFRYAGTWRVAGADGRGGAVRMVGVPGAVGWDARVAGSGRTGVDAGAVEVSVDIGPGGGSGGEDIYAEVSGQPIGETACGGVTFDEADGGGAVPVATADQIAVLLRGEGAVADSGMSVRGEMDVGGEALRIRRHTMWEVADRWIAAMVRDPCGGSLGVERMQFIQ